MICWLNLQLKRQRFTTIAAVFGLLLWGFVFGPSTGFAQGSSETCRENATEVGTDGGSLRLRDYLCQTDNGARVRVQLHRVDDTVAHAALTNSMPPELSAVLGNAEILPNAVSATFGALMDQFGEAQSFPCFQFRQFAPGQDMLVNGELDCENDAVLTTLGGWRDPWNSPNDSFPAIDDIRSIFLENKVPSTYTTIEFGATWRYVNSRDLEDLEGRIQLTNDVVRLDGDPSKAVTYPKELALMRHVAGGRLPKGFAALEISDYGPGGCDTAGWTLSYTPRPMVVEIALIENVSRQPVDLSELVGLTSRTEKLRRSRSSTDIKGARVSPLGHQRMTLGPRERAIVFQRMSFVTEFDREDIALFKFDYGPAEFLRGFDLNGQRVDLNERSHNATLLTMSTEGGSCPFLYAYDGDRWINHGKVLHDAKGAGLKQWDDTQFDGFQGVFRLAELEPELGIIDQAILAVTLVTGDVLQLLPDRAALASQDNQSEKIYMNEAFEMRFELPNGIEEGDVVSSNLRLLGYYERYTSLFRNAGISKRAAETARACIVYLPDAHLAEKIAMAD